MNTDPQGLDSPTAISQDARETALTAPAPSARFAAYLPWLLVLVVIVFLAAVRIRLLSTPLERDEGEYAYVGQLMLEGVPPYKIAFNMKFPGTYGAYAAIMAVFGQSIAGIHLGFLLVNAATIVFIFLLGRRLWNASAGVASCAAYGLMSVGAGVMGTQAHATHFVVLAAVPATLLLLRALDNARWWTLAASGFLYGVAILMKQHAALFALFGALFLLWSRYRRPGRTLASALRLQSIFWSGVAAPLILTGLALWRAGVFARFWFWTITYARQYVSVMPLRAGIVVFTINASSVVQENAPIWILAMVGLLFLWFRAERTAAVCATGLLVSSFLAVCPGLYFREHYFILILPAIALLAGSIISSVEEFWPRARWVGIAAVAAILAISIVQQSYFLFSISPLDLSRQMYGPSPFAEAIPIAEYLRAHTEPGARIAVLGSEPEIPFYAHRRLTSGYLYTYSMMEPQPYALQMQNEWIREVEAAPPEYLVAVGVSNSWSRMPLSTTRIFDWWEDYVPRNYDAVGIAEIDPASPPNLRWGNVANIKRHIDDVLIVYRRKGR